MSFRFDPHAERELLIIAVMNLHREPEYWKALS
jgi:hypothetical protein